MTFQESLTKIKNAVYGIEVREAIYSSLLYLKNNSSGDGNGDPVEDASNIIFDNSGTGLTSTNVQEVIEELNYLIDHQASKFDTNILFAKDYIKNGVLNISDIPITSNCFVWFDPDVYTVTGGMISNVNDVTFDLMGSVLNLNDYFVEISGCNNFELIGGTFNNADEIAIKVLNTQNFRINHSKINNTGSSSAENASAIQLLGDCDNFEVIHCCIDGVAGGVVSSDGYIHAYGILINRLNSSNAYTKNGVIKQCSITNVAGIDSGNTKADGDGIFVNNPPYLNNGSVVWRNDINITIKNCTITDCKKRGIKLASAGVKIADTYIDGEMWYSGVDCQYGYADINNCIVINRSDYNNSITSGIVCSEGGVNIRDCTIKAPYGKYTFHPAIRFNKRLPASVIPDETPWDNVYIDNCYFDEVSYPIHAYVSDTTKPIPIRGLYITNCRFGNFNQSHAVNVSNTMFSSIECFVFTDWRIDFGSNRTDVKAKNSNFVYPVSISLDPTITFELHSRHWTAEPMTGYENLPTSPNGYIEYTGTIGSIFYKKYTSHGSIIKGNRNPSNTTATLSKQLLYNSKVGDIYIDTTNGKCYICTTAGTSSNIGTWTAL